MLSSFVIRGYDEVKPVTGWSKVDCDYFSADNPERASGGQHGAHPPAPIANQIFTMG